MVLIFFVFHAKDVLSSLFFISLTLDYYLALSYKAKFKPPHKVQSNSYLPEKETENLLNVEFFLRPPSDCTYP